MRRGFIVPVVIMLFFAVPAFIVFAPVENVEAYLVQKITPPRNEAMVQRWIQWLRESNFTQIEQGLDPSLRTDDSVSRRVFGLCRVVRVSSSACDLRSVVDPQDSSRDDLGRRLSGLRGTDQPLHRT
jgi:hypothetical protein